MEPETPPQTYEVIESPKPPKLPGTVVFRPDDDEALGSAAADMFMQALGCVRAFGSFQLAVSGSPANEPFFRRLMLDPSYRDFPWAKTHLWLVDELAVDWDDPRRRATTVRELLAEPSDLPRSQLHLIDLDADDPAEAYQRQIGDVLGWREKGHDRFDYILLDPTDTPEQFPEDAVSPTGPLVASFTGCNPQRIAMTFRAYQGARCVAGIVTGQSARPAVAALALRTHPFAQLRLSGGDLRWYIDHAAARGAGT